MNVRPLTEADLPFARAMLFESIVPPLPGEREAILALPELAKYVAGWGRPGDRGFVAELDGEPAGAAWRRLFPEDAPGYGFVDAQTPEVSTLAVVREARGRGVGRALLDALVEATRADGYAQLSLSVARVNEAALRLYEAAGFVAREDVASSNEHSVTMLLPL